MHASFLQCNAVPSAASDGNELSERQNSVTSGCHLVADGQKTVPSANHKGSIKQTNTSQVLVSETVPDRRVQPSRQVKMTRFGTILWPALCLFHPEGNPDITPLPETGGILN